ncbi:MAG TPA: response regulator transcription factor, partial [Beutenbergiaceae bacterium]|nr:response regulator transcription factor [Beutenbergiaceae bacterium]
GIDGIELIKAIASAHQEVEVLVLTTFDSREDVTAALAAGARSYLVKDTERARLFEAVRATADGRRALSPSVQRQVRAGARDAAAAGVGTRAEPALSEREHQVLTLVARGRTNAQIGVDLFIGEATVKTHLQHIYAKLGASDRAAAVAVGYRHGLL